MIRGTIYLDYEGEPQFKVDVTQFIWREDEVVFDFSGVDEGSKYSGSCQLARNGDAFEGEASYRYDKESNVHRARIVLTLDAEDGEISATGAWTDDGETEPYDLGAELFDASS
jgi:hypothetical protein